MKKVLGLIIFLIASSTVSAESNKKTREQLDKIYLGHDIQRVMVDRYTEILERKGLDKEVVKKWIQYRIDMVARCAVHAWAVEGSFNKQTAKQLRQKIGFSGTFLSHYHYLGMALERLKKIPDYVSYANQLPVGWNSLTEEITAIYKRNSESKEKEGKNSTEFDNLYKVCGSIYKDLSSLEAVVERRFKRDRGIE